MKITYKLPINKGAVIFIPEHDNEISFDNITARWEMTPMKYDPDKHHRRPIRLKGYDYSQAGAYFVTICTQNRECLFGDVIDGEMQLNDAGQMIRDVWHKIPEHFSHADIDEFVVMPNHFHGIIVIVGAQFIAPFDFDAIKQDKKQIKQDVMNHAPTTVGEIVRAFKARCTRAINQIHNTPGCPVWQRNYYEHIIRNEEEIDRIREYIINNPLKWEYDENNPANINHKGAMNHAPTNFQ